MSSQPSHSQHLSAAPKSPPVPVLLFKTVWKVLRSTVWTRVVGENRNIVMSSHSMEQVCIHCRKSLKVPHHQCHSLNSHCCARPESSPVLGSTDVPSSVPTNPAVNVTKCRFCNSHANSPQVRSSSKKSSTFSDAGWGKFLPLVIFGISLLLLPISTMSNPVPSPAGSSGGSGDGNPGSHHRHHTKSHEREQKWINPCRIPSALPTFATDGHVQPQPDEDIIHNIRVQATKAESQALDFFRDFYNEAFGGDPASDRYERFTYDFLTDIMKEVNAGYSDERLATLQLEDTIRFLYQGLQKFAVGLEAIVLDQACYGGSFYHHFNEAEFQLKYVLCELQIAMLEKNISHTDITREVMMTQYRDLADKTTRNIRDWSIFRDYVKTLRYVHHVMKHFQLRPKTVVVEQS